MQSGVTLTMPMSSGLIQAEAGEGRPLGGDALDERREVGAAITLTCERMRREHPPLGAAGLALDQLGSREGDRTAGQRQRQAVGDRRHGRSAIEEPDRPEIELRISHARDLSRSVPQETVTQAKCPA